MTDVVVIGAGVAGLTAARSIAREGLRVTVLEARQRIGGRVHTLRDVCDAPVEAGAELVHGKHAQTWPDLKAAGVTVRPNSHGATAMMLDLGDGARWLPHALLHPQTWASLDVLRRLASPPQDDMSARDFIERCGYRGRSKHLAEMVLTSHLPGSLDEIGIRGFIDDGVLQLETSADYRVNEGYDRLVEHIGRDLDVQFGFEAQTVEWSENSVTIFDAGGRERNARVAISTLPVGVLQSDAVRFKPELPESKRTALAQMVMGPVLKVIIRFGERFWPARLAALCSATGPVTLYWNVFYKGVREEPVLTAYCTGPRAAALAGLSEDETIARIIEDLRAHFPRSAPKIVAWRVIDWSADPYARGGYSFLRPRGAGARARFGALDTGALIWAGSETATEPIAATVGGAYASGLRAARDAIAMLDRIEKG